jgi:hypothetical protein
MPTTTTPALAPNRILFSQSDIESYHWAKWVAADNSTCYTLSGVIKVSFQGNSTSNWLRQQIKCVMNIPELTTGWGLHLKYWAPYAGLNSIYNQNQSNNSGFSVDNFNVVDRETSPLYGQSTITLSIDIAARDTDAFLYRVGFNVTIVGVAKVLRPIPPIPIAGS